MKTPYCSIIGQTAGLILFAVLFPIIVLYAVDRSISAQDYAAGIPLEGCIFESNCNLGSFE